MSPQASETARAGQTADGVASSPGGLDESMGEDRVPEQHEEGAPTTVVGVIGLGDIGDGVATSLLAAGFPLVVCDLRTEVTDRYADKATVAGSPADLAERSDVLIVAVVNDAQVHAVLSGPEGRWRRRGRGPRASWSAPSPPRAWPPSAPRRPARASTCSTAG